MNASPTSEAIGQTPDTAVFVSRSVSAPIAHVWQVLMTRAGAEALLGEGAALGAKGEDWVANDGTRGVIRSFHPKEQLRFSWHADEAAPRTMVELDLADEGDATNLTLTQSGLADDADRVGLREHWEKVLDRIDGAAAG